MVKKAVITLLKTTYVAAILAWVILGCGLQIATSRAGIAVLEAIMVIGFGSWILQNYCEWRWDRWNH